MCSPHRRYRSSSWRTTPQDVLVRELLRLLRRAIAGRPLTWCLPTGRFGTVRHLAEWLHLAPRSLRDRMYRDIGTSPKRTLRILRLHRSLHEAWRCGLDGRLPGGGLLAFVAHEAGYADQAHFTREARALLGEAPSNWYARGSAVPFKTPRKD
jgi:AraC-like DNA-binding protein